MTQLSNLVYLDRSYILLLLLVWAIFHIRHVSSFQFLTKSNIRSRQYKTFTSLLLLISLTLCVIVDFLTGFLKYHYGLSQIPYLPLPWYFVRPLEFYSSSYADSLFRFESLFNVSLSIKTAAIFYIVGTWYHVMKNHFQRVSNDANKEGKSTEPPSIPLNDNPSKIVSPNEAEIGKELTHPADEGIDAENPLRDDETGSNVNADPQVKMEPKETFPFPEANDDENLKNKKSNRPQSVDDHSEKPLAKSTPFIIFLTLTILHILATLILQFVFKDDIYKFIAVAELVYLASVFFLIILVKLTITQLEKFQNTQNKNSQTLVSLVDDHIGNLYGLMFSLSLELIGLILIDLDIFSNFSMSIYTVKLRLDICTCISLMGFIGSFIFSFLILFPSKLFSLRLLYL